MAHAVCNGPEGCKGVYKYLIGLMAAKRFISIKWGKRPQRGPSAGNGPYGRKAAHKRVMGPKAAKRPISV